MCNETAVWNWHTAIYWKTQLTTICTPQQRSVQRPKPNVMQHEHSTHSATQGQNTQEREAIHTPMVTIILTHTYYQVLESPLTIMHPDSTHFNQVLKTLYPLNNFFSHCYTNHELFKNSGSHISRYTLQLSLNNSENLGKLKRFQRHIFFS